MIFKLIIQNSSFGTHYEIALCWMPQNLTIEKSTLLQVMAWCHQAPSHYLIQCWSKFMLQYGITRPQWLNQSRKNIERDNIALSGNNTIKLRQDCLLHLIRKSSSQWLLNKMTINGLCNKPNILWQKKNCILINFLICLINRRKQVMYQIIVQRLSFQV